MEGMLVHYDGTIRNSNSQMIQLRYGEDGMDGALMEFQQIPIIKPSHATFKRKFYLDPTNHRHVNLINIIITSYDLFVVPYRQLRTNFQEDVVRDILTSSEAQTNLELEFEQLKKDRINMREIFPTGNSKVYYSVSL